MIKRTVEVSTPETFIFLKQNHLVFENSGGETGRVPCEDLGILVLGTPRLTITHAALSACVEAGAAVISCGSDHNPTGLLLPVAGNTLHAQKLRDQLSATQPAQKQMWRQIVKAKIAMQAATLPLDRTERARLRALGDEVKSGDPDNREAQAARFYWPALFNDPMFRRSREGPPPNDLLNYGYMVLRAAMARAICGAGLHPALGLHHRHRENPFALADDLMEPYRPFVDRRVAEHRLAGGNGLDKSAKARLLAVLTDAVQLGEEKGPLLVAMQKTAASASACFSGEADKLKLPAP